MRTSEIDAAAITRWQDCAAGKDTEAVSHFELCTRLTPENKGAHYQLARAYRLAGDVEKADQEMTRFKALGPEDAEDVDSHEQRLEHVGRHPGRPHGGDEQFESGGNR